MVSQYLPMFCFLDKGRASPLVNRRFLSSKLFVIVFKAEDWSARTVFREHPGIVVTNQRDFWVPIAFCFSFYLWVNNWWQYTAQSALGIPLLSQGLSALANTCELLLVGSLLRADAGLLSVAILLIWGRWMPEAGSLKTIRGGRDIRD